MMTTITSASQQSIETLGKVNVASARGFHEFSKYFLATMTSAFEDAVAAGKELATAKTPIEFFQLQSKVAQEAMETMIGEAKKASDLAASMMKDITAPFSETITTASKASLKKAA